MASPAADPFALRSVRQMNRDTGTSRAPLEPGQTASLLALVQQRNEDAMACLFAAHSKLVYSVALRVLRDPGAAEDVLQEVFLQIWRNPSTFVSARGSLQAWLAVSARNRAIDLLRRRRPSDSVDDVVLFAPYDLAGDSEHTLMIEKARAVIAELPDEQRKTLELAFFDGLTHAEIAKQTGNPLGTVKTRIRSALQTLGKVLRP